MALTRGSAVAARRAAVMLSEPMALPVSGLRPLRPRLIAPVAWISATTSWRGAVSCFARLASSFDRW